MRKLDLAQQLKKAIGDHSTETIDAREELGARVQRELLPYLLKSQTVERFYTKPRGYSGDFRTTELVYRREPHGEGKAGLLLDRCFLDLAPIAAVRNRRALLTEGIYRRAAKSAQPFSVTAICSGPGDELFAAYERLSPREPLAATLIDFDAQALAAVAARRDKLKLDAQLRVLCHLGPLVPRQRPAKLIGQRRDRARDRVAHCHGSVPGRRRKSKSRISFTALVCPITSTTSW